MEPKQEHFTVSKQYQSKRVPVWFPVLLILFLVALVRSAQTYFFLFGGEKTLLNLLRIFLSNLAYFLYFTPLSVVAHTLTRRFPFQHTPLRKLLVVHGIVVLTSFILHQTLMLGVEQFLWQPELLTSAILYRYLNNPTIWIDLFVYLLLILWFYIGEYRELNQQRELRKMQIEAEVANARLQELKNTLHPNFLFSTFHTLSHLIEDEKYNEANMLIAQLSDYLRVTVYSSTNEIATVEEELEYLRLYLSLLSAQHTSPITLTEYVVPEARTCVLPKFTLQPLVEYAINTFGRDGIVQPITFFAQREDSFFIFTLVLTVTSKVENLENQKNFFGYVTQRLEALYGTQVRAALNVQCENELHCTLTVPYIGIPTTS